MSNNIKLQVKSRGQYLNILGLGSDNGTNACQGVLPTTKNFSWEMIDAPGNPGWYLLQVKSSNKYLCIDGSSQNNGANAVQQDLPSPLTDNFLWGKAGVPNSPLWCLFKVKHSGQFLNIFEGGNVNGQRACQGVANTTDNFFWLEQPDKTPKAVKIYLQVDCCGLVGAQPQGGKVEDETANLYLVFSDDNHGQKENNNQSSFESKVYAGSQVTWKPSILDVNNNSQFDLRIDSFQADSNSANIFNLGSVKANGDSLSADVKWTAIPLANGADNETYTVYFSILNRTTGNWIPYNVDPKLRVDPGTATDK